MTAPFWGGNDTWSDLLPVIHYQKSILEDHQLPLNTDQWYGGREQWKNPLWNFLYLPGTLIWLGFPLDWATRIIFVGHFLFSLYAGWKLAALYLDNEFQRIFAAIIFISPNLPAYLAGHVEKILSWGWVLLALYFLLNPRLSDRKRGLMSGLCFGVIPLTGSNYYSFFSFILFIPLLAGIKNKKIIPYFIGGAAIGLLHLPSVAYLIGVQRANSLIMIQISSMNLFGILSSLIVGFALPVSWETWGLVGIGVGVLFVKLLWLEINEERIKFFRIFDERKALLTALFILSLFASGLIYRGNHLFDTFRVPARAIFFMALTILLYCLISNQYEKNKKPLNLTFYLGISAFQIILLTWLIRPIGSQYSYRDPGVKELTTLLNADHAKSVWINKQLPINMNIDVGLTQQGFQLPNVYYGDMGQKIPVSGNICGYSFDHVITEEDPPVILKPNLEGENFSIPLPLEKLELIGRIPVNGEIYKVYRVRC